MNTLGELERRVMEQLWHGGRPQSVREVHGVLVGERDIAYTTVMTVLDRLSKKGLAVREQHGRAYRYTAAQSRERLVAAAMHDVLTGTADERSAALQAFVEGVSEDEAATLRTALVKHDAARQKGQKTGTRKTEARKKTSTSGRPSFQ